MRLAGWIRTVTAVACLVGACATPPKPRELQSFEKLRSSAAGKNAAQRAPDLVKSADTWLNRARTEWDDGELEDAANSSMMGEIKLRHAIAVSDQERAKQKIADADLALGRARDEHSRLQRDLNAINELVAALKKLHETTSQASAERQALAEQLEKERLKAGASDRIADAELAVKGADTVHAQTHAKAQYAAAVELLAKAQQQFQQGDFPGAQTSAEDAKKRADEAIEIAKPLYTQEAQGAESRARAEALARDAAAIVGGGVRREARGALQRLIVTVGAERLFNRRETTLGAGKEAVLDPIAALIKRYPTYPVQVVGYTDNRGRMGELLALSLARAQSVFSALVFRGVDAKRMVVSGQGAAEPVADNRTAAGRARNNRIEIVFLYQ